MPFRKNKNITIHDGEHQNKDPLHGLGRGEKGERVARNSGPAERNTVILSHLGETIDTGNTVTNREDTTNFGEFAGPVERVELGLDNVSGLRDGGLITLGKVSRSRGVELGRWTRKKRNRGVVECFVPGPSLSLFRQ